IYYEGNSITQDLLNEFEQTYESNRAIWWYTRDCFLYRMLNRALRQQNIKAIFLFGFFIVDLFKQIKQINQFYFNSSSIRVYRGQLMFQKEVKRILSSIAGGLDREGSCYGPLDVCVNTFFSATRNRDVALMFAGQESSIFFNNDLQSVIFEIKVNLTQNETQYADISTMSVIDDEEEFLFLAGCVFQMTSIHYDYNDKIWIIKMNALNNHDRRLRLGLNESQSTGIELIGIGNALFYRGNKEKGKRWDIDMKAIIHNIYYNLILRQLDPNDIHVPACFAGLANIYSIDNPDLAFEYKTKALVMYENHFPNQHNDVIAYIYSLFGDIFWFDDEYDLALYYYKKYLSYDVSYRIIKNISLIWDDPAIQIAYIYKIMNNFEWAWKAFKTFITPNMIQSDPDYVCSCYEKLSLTNQIKANYDVRLESQKKFIDFTMNTNDIIIYYSPIAEAYYKLGDNCTKELNNFAIECFEKCLEIRIKYDKISCQLKPQYESGTIKNCIQEITNLYKKNGELNLIIQFYERILYLCTIYQSENINKIAFIYEFCANFYFEQNNFHLTMDYYKKAIKLINNQGKIHFEHDLSSSCQLLIRCYTNLAEIYEKQDQYLLAIESYQNIINIYMHNPLKECIQMIIYFSKRVANIYKKQNEFHLAIECYQKAIEYFLNDKHIFFNSIQDWLNYKTNSFPYKYRLQYYKEYANIYEKNGHYDLAIEYLDKTIEYLFKFEHIYVFKDIANCYQNIASIYTMNKDFVLAIQYYKLALSIYKRYEPDLHLFYRWIPLNETYDIIYCPHFKDKLTLSLSDHTMSYKRYSIRDISDVYKDIAILYEQYNDMEMSNHWHNKTKDISMISTDEIIHSMIYCYRQMANLYAEIDDYTSAIQCYQIIIPEYLSKITSRGRKITKIFPF
ncbi:unnamed protein product, partial [Rotaria sp. Silwood2]